MQSSCNSYAITWEIHSAGIIFMQVLCNPRCAIQVFPNYHKDVNPGSNSFMQLLGHDYVTKIAGGRLLL